MLSGSGRSHRAFTLVELLVVIGIIAVLIAILLPVLNRVRAQSILLKCTANQRSMAQAARIYANDNNDWLGRDGFGGWGAFTSVLIAPKMGYDQPDPVQASSDLNFVLDYLRPIPNFKCPAVNEGYVLMYVVNSIDFDYYRDTGKYREGGGNPAGFSKYSRTPNPTQAMLMVEVNMTTLAADAVGNYNIWNTGDLPFDSSGNPNAGGSRRMIAANDTRHLGKTTIAFFDGHAASVPLAPNAITSKMLNGIGP